MAGRLRLQVRDADGERERQFDGGTIVVGREHGSPLVVNDPLVSRAHGRFELRPDGWYFIDAGSRNGSLYNGRRLIPEQGVTLRPGDTVRLGNALVTVIEAVWPTRPVAPLPPGPASPGGTGAARSQAYPSMPPAAPPPPVQQVLRQTQVPPRPARPANVGVRDSIFHVGRAIDNDIVFDNGFVSSYHLEVWPQDGGLMVRDLGSRNGTFVNGRRITQQVLPPAAVLQLGHPHITLPVADILRRLSAAPEPSLYMQRPDDLEHLIAGQGLGRSVGKERKVILRDVDVSVRRGQFIAIVGGSGTGKSTLMKVLNGYTPPETGVMLYARNAQGRPEEIGYVPQEDIIHPELPLRDALVLSAMLRYPPGTPREIVEQRAGEVLAQLGLSEHIHTLVARLSGGQRKRASVALELMRNPRLLILDEPTSSLDPASGRRVIKLLRSLANTGVGILLVTHAMEHVLSCDSIVFLAPGGNLVFWGTLDEAMQHFGTSDLAAVYDMLDPEGAAPEGKQAAVQHWRRRFVESPQYQRLRRQVDGGMRALAPMQQWAPLPPQDQSELTRWQLKGLAVRYWRTMLSDRRNLLLLLGQVPIIVLLARILFDHDVLEAFANPQSAGPASKGLNLLFILGTSLVWFGTINAAREICKEHPIWERESHVGVRPVPYVLSKALVLSALAGVQTLVLVALFFLLWRVPGDGAIAGVLLAGFLAAFSGVALGLAISAAAPSPDRAMTLVPVAMIPQIMFGGVIIPLAEMGGGRWMSAVIPSRWTFEAFGRLTDRATYLGSPRVAKVYDQVDGPWIVPVLALIVLGAAFTAMAIWLVARTAPKHATAGRVPAPPHVPGRAPVGQ